ncbi:GntR family transcriptional regulator [Leuconostoc citreum]|uniref:GntR family transcriptional regulator n=1 Tax=Leuconostoc citreum TaxID=33964 RepID=UPI002A818355|nr:GntR family transcriptional regulator [Leuconostoc citreum]MDY5162332.1 GntR family transcriptional regulator [Leuconostoc citreum]MDY5165857.1 GntR family transcriptional regulator [Leuconostoc citreum]
MPSKYETVKKYILDQIVTGELQKDQKLPTESEMMATFSVSRYTIRRAISDLENENYVYRIQGGGSFVTDWQTQRAPDKMPRVIGILSTHVASYIFPAIIDGADQVISDSGFSLSLANTHNQPAKERTALINLMSQNLAGLIVEPTQSAIPTPNIDLYQKLQKMAIPIVFINAGYQNVADVSVISDDSEAIYRATNYLISKGHHRIVGVFQVDDQQGVNRLDGYMKAYQAHSALLTDCMPMMYKSDDVTQALHQINELVVQSPTKRPTAIIAYNDQLAIRIIAMIHDLGLRVPEDISVLGFDDFQLSQYLSPRLTTMTHEKQKMGQDAAKLLIQKINHHKVASIIYRPELIERDSVKDLSVHDD